MQHLWAVFTRPTGQSEHPLRITVEWEDTAQTFRDTEMLSVFPEFTPAKAQAERRAGRPLRRVRPGYWTTDPADHGPRPGKRAVLTPPIPLDPKETPA